MTKSRIAIFEGYGRRPTRRSSRRGYGAPLFQNPRAASTRLLGYGRSGYGYDVESMPPGMGSYGRRGYFVPAVYRSSRMGPQTSSGRKTKVLKRKGYHVKKGRNTAAQVRFKKAAKKCARVARGRNARKGSYQACMRKTLKKRRSRR